MQDLTQDRQSQIHNKGFDMSQQINYNKIKVGPKILEDAVLNLSTLKTTNKKNYTKGVVLKALADRDLPKLREISNYFYETNGIYKVVCHYYAFLYRYDWFVTAEIFDKKGINEDKLTKEFYQLLSYLDNSQIKQTCGEIALKIIKNGAYYAYVVPNPDRLLLQELPVSYCRSRYNIGNSPAIEFNMRFFDDNFRDINYRMRVLKMFPKEFQVGYALYKQGKLPPDNTQDALGGWYLLTPGSAIKFSFYNNYDVPFFANAIPGLLDLDAAQELDRRKQMQRLLKILIQKLPLDKNGDLIFDIDEARDIHTNAVEMLSSTIGVDVLTTFADISMEDLADTAASTAIDDLEKVERSAFNAMGVSKNIFNADGNIAVTNSILQDESTVRNLLLQFSDFFNKAATAHSSNKKKYNFKLWMLEKTQYNYRDLSKMYKEQTQMGCSKVLPQVALGQSQSFILHSAYFENQVMNLPAIMIPPIMSSTLNGEDILGAKNKETTTETQKKSNGTKTETTAKKIDVETKEAGRPETPDNEKSEKTIQNKESMG